MKLALVTDTFAPRVGGIEAQVAGLAAALRRRGHVVDVLTATNGPVRDGIVRFPGIGGAVPNPLVRGRVRDVLCGYDLVHAHMGVLSPFAQAAVGDAMDRQPTVVTVHSMLASAGTLVGPLLRRWAQHGVVLTAVSAVAAADVERAGGSEVLVVPNAVDLARWRPPGPRTPGLPVAAVCTTRLAERKRVIPLVRAFARAVAAVPEGSLRLVVVGDGPQRRLLDAARARHGIEGSVDLVGTLDHERLREIYWGADVFVSPVRLEAFGIAALEARAAGLPVIGYRTSGVAGLVAEGRTGLLVDGDLALASSLERLVREPALLAGLQECSAAHPPPFDWADTLDAVERAYGRAAARVAS